MRMCREVAVCGRGLGASSAVSLQTGRGRVDLIRTHRSTAAGGRPALNPRTSPAGAALLISHDTFFTWRAAPETLAHKPPVLSASWPGGLTRAGPLSPVQTWDHGGGGGRAGGRRRQKVSTGVD